MNTKKIIAVDMDDTLQDFIPHWINAYNKKYNDKLHHSQITEWDVTKFIKPECGVKIYELLNEPNFFANMTPKESSQEVTKWLSEYYDIYIVTNSHYKTYDEKIKWVMKHYPHLKIEDGKFITLKNKYLFKADYLIDDGAHNIESFPNTSLLINMPHNQNYVNEDKTKRVYRVNNWSEIAVFFSKEMIKDKEKQDV
jgi:5'(3')-deoxyribonucleotidase